jgi:IclR family transcriptional regulator, acetate operon repressor
LSHNDAASSLSLMPRTKPKPEPANRSSSERSLRLLALLADEGRAQTLAELSQRLALPKATTHRLCAQLLAGGYLARDIDERSFVVGPALRRLALDALNHGSTRALRHAVLADLVDKVGETCNFTTLDGASVLYLDRVEAPWPWRLTMDVGVHVPLHCTASGKLFLAFMPEAERDAVITHLVLARLTPNTITAPRDLRRECEDIVRSGHALDREEFITGLVALAVPVRDGKGQVRAAIAVHAPSVRMSMATAVARLPALAAAAKRMGRLL